MKDKVKALVEMIKEQSRVISDIEDSKEKRLNELVDIFANDFSKELQPHGLRVFSAELDYKNCVEIRIERHGEKQIFIHDTILVLEKLKEMGILTARVFTTDKHIGVEMRW